MLKSNHEKWQRSKYVAGLSWCAFGRLKRDCTKMKKMNRIRHHCGIVAGGAIRRKIKGQAGCAPILPDSGIMSKAVIRAGLGMESAMDSAIISR
ncbi:MAG: hypothetical protein GZ090_09210 [Oxalobacteraceae bacterium]|nr:hypothetical protein [Oxalobacteraceae bacterium]